MADNNLSKDTRNTWIAVAIVLVIAIIVILAFRPFEGRQDNQPNNQPMVTDNDNKDEDDARAREEAAVRQTVTTLGERLKNVSLLSPNVNAEIRDNFRDLATADLLSEWQSRPELAPGRLVSSPVPDRIEIRSIQKQPGGDYRVDADIVEVATGTTTVSRRGIALTLTPVDDRWIISAASLAPYDAADSWQRADQSGVRFRYPATIGTKYISTQTWPPTIKTETDADFMCPVSEPRNGESIRNTRVNGRDYCVRTRNEGAAGSTYSSYDYSTLTGDRLITATFTLRYPQCANYGASEAAICQTERTEFDLDSLIDRIIRTVE